MKDVVGVQPEKDYGVFNNFRENAESLSTGLIAGGIAVLAFTAAAEMSSIVPVALATAVGFTMQVLINAGNPEAVLNFTTKNKPLFFTGLIAPLLIAGGMTMGTIIDNQSAIIEQNNQIIETIQAPTP